MLNGHETTTRRAAPSHRNLAAAIAVALGLAATAGAEEGAAASDPQVRGDGSVLAHKVEAALRQDATLVEPQALKLTITAKGGTVTLSGTAGTIHDREQAARVAEGASGAAAIRPSITVKATAAIEGAALEEACVEAVRKANVMGASFTVKASAGGAVTLGGEVINEWAAVEAVKRVPGVTAIAGYSAQRPGQAPPAADAALQIVAPSPDQDGALAERIKESLKASGLGELTCEVKGGVAHLGGKSKSIRDLMRASQLALAVPGVLGVNNERLSAPAPAYRVGDARDSAAIESDVRRQVWARFARGPEFRIDDLDVRVLDGTVVVQGRARSDDAAYAAIEAISWVPGVREVINALSYPAQVHGS